MLTVFVSCGKVRAKPMTDISDATEREQFWPGQNRYEFRVQFQTLGRDRHQETIEPLY